MFLLINEILSASIATLISVAIMFLWLKSREKKLQANIKENSQKVDLPKSPLLPLREKKIKKQKKEEYRFHRLLQKINTQDSSLLNDEFNFFSNITVLYNKVNSNFFQFFLREEEGAKEQLIIYGSTNVRGNTSAVIQEIIRKEINKVRTTGVNSPSSLLAELQNSFSSFRELEPKLKHIKISIGVCHIEQNKNKSSDPNFPFKLTFAGAGIPLIFFKRNIEEFAVLTGSSFHINQEGFIKPHFKDVRYLLAKNDLIFMGSRRVFDQNRFKEDESSLIRFKKVIESNLNTSAEKLNEAIIEQYLKHPSFENRKYDLSLYCIKL